MPKDSFQTLFMLEELKAIKVKNCQVERLHCF